MRTDDQQKMIDALRFDTNYPIQGQYGNPHQWLHEHDENGRAIYGIGTCAIGTMALAMGARWVHVGEIHWYPVLNAEKVINEHLSIRLKGHIITMNDQRNRSREFIARFLEKVWTKGD